MQTKCEHIKPLRDRLKLKEIEGGKLGVDYGRRCQTWQNFRVRQCENFAREGSDFCGYHKSYEVGVCYQCRTGSRFPPEEPITEIEQDWIDKVRAMSPEERQALVDRAHAGEDVISDPDDF